MSAKSKSKGTIVRRPVFQPWVIVIAGLFLIGLGYFILATQAANRTVPITVNSGSSACSASPSGSFSPSKVATLAGDQVTLIFEVPSGDPSAGGAEIRGFGAAFTVPRGSSRSVSFTASSGFAFSAWQPGSSCHFADGSISVDQSSAPPAPPPSTPPSTPPATPPATPPNGGPPTTTPRSPVGPTNSGPTEPLPSASEQTAAPAPVTEAPSAVKKSEPPIYNPIQLGRTVYRFSTARAAGLGVTLGVIGLLIIAFGLRLYLRRHHLNKL